MSFETEKGTAYAVLFAVLSVFTLLAIFTVPQISKFIPESTRAFCCISKGTENGKDYFLSARNSASALAICLSFFASGMGAWVLYGSTELGATPAVSWFGVLGYSIASGFPAIIICFLGPKIRELTQGQDAFSTTDFARARYGRLMQLVTSCVSVFYMFIYIVAEMTSISSVYGEVVRNEQIFTQSVTISIGIFTIFYTTVAGLPASIVTDKFQSVIIVIVVLMLLVSVTSFKENRVTPSEFAEASKWTIDGVMALISLVIAIAAAELFNQSTWQRVWAAESVPAMRKGFFMGSIMVFFLMMFFGIMGMIAYAKEPQSYDSGILFRFMAFFNILRPLSAFWHVMLLILVTALAASSIDSLQNALTCIFSHDLVKLGWNPLLITRVLLILVNIPAIIMSAKGYSVISLFLVADLVCATSALPLYLGLQTGDKAMGWLKAPTELGALSGCLAGVISVIINGYINGANDDGPFSYFWLENGDICALCGTKTMLTFIITPIVSLVFTYLISFVDVHIRGERARKPLIIFSFDVEDEKNEEAQLSNLAVNDDTEANDKSQEA